MEVTPENIDLDVQFAGEPLEALSQAWRSSELGVGQLARAVSRHFANSRMTLEGAARFLGAPPAELEALLGLASLPDDDLEKINQVNPPKTTWLFFAEADSAEISAGLSALISSGAAEIAAQRVYEAMREVGSPTIDDRIAAISGATLGHLAHKAKEYDVLSKKARQFLGSLAQRKRVGQPLSEKQLDWLKAILFELVDRGVIRRETPDGDQAQCDEVLCALGR